MISLITGTPGTGKTLYLLKYIQQILAEYRFIYVHGIPDLKFPHELVVCQSKTCDFCQSLSDYAVYKKVEDWVQYAEEGSVFFIDEVQQVYRAKRSVPVTDFETHRHKGLDFYLVTQHPMLIAPDLRRLVGKHIHLVKDFLGRRQYEWSQCSQNLSKSGAVRSLYKLDKELFDKYLSASQHTKISHKVPLHFFVLIIAILFAGYNGYGVYKSRFVSQPAAVDVPVLPSSPPASLSTPKKSDQKQRRELFELGTDLEKLPESEMWRLVLELDFTSSNKAGFVLKSDRYKVEHINGTTRYVSARLCRVVYSDVMCVIGGRLVARWTGVKADKPVKVVDSGSSSSSSSTTTIFHPHS